VKNDEVITQIREAYAKSKARALPPVVLPLEPKQTAPREVVEEAPIELGHFHFAWHTPELRHPDVPVLDVLAVLLGSGRSSRLYQEVREKQGVVNYADAWTYNPGGPGLLGMSAVVDPDKFERARDAMLTEVEKLKTTRIPAHELSKAVKQFISATLATRKTMQGQAQDLGGNWLAANDLNFSERYLAAVKRIAPADVQRVARQYLTTENRTLYALLPNGAAPRTTTATEKTSEQAIQKLVLPNGLRLLVKEDHRLPFVEFRAAFQGGVLAENRANNGITQLLAKMLLKGTKKRSAEDIAREIESVGGSIDSYGGNNSFGVNVEVLSSDFGTGMDLLADVLLSPVFPAPALAREQQVQIAGIRSQKDELLKSASKAMRRALFGDRGYGLDALGTEESVQATRRADLKAFHEKLASPNNCVLAIYGDVKTAGVKAAVEKAFARWKSSSPPPAINHKPSTINSLQRVTETRDKKQAVLVIGFPGTTLRAADRHALELLQEACSDLGSRLFLRIREKLGLAYYVGAQNFVGLAPGYFAFYAGTEPEKAGLVEKEILKEADLLRAEGLSSEELQRAKAKVIGQKKIARQDLGTLAMTTALDELYGLGYDYTEAEDAKIEAVTLEQVKAAANKYLKPDALVIAMVKPDDASPKAPESEPKGNPKPD
jgi:zinc protease